MRKYYQFQQEGTTLKNGHKKFDYAVQTNDDRLLILSSFQQYQFSPEIEVIIIYEKQSRYNYGSTPISCDSTDTSCDSINTRYTYVSTDTSCGSADTTHASTDTNFTSYTSADITFCSQHAGPIHGRKRSTSGRGKQGSKDPNATRKVRTSRIIIMIRIMTISKTSSHLFK